MTLNLYSLMDYVRANLLIVTSLCSGLIEVQNNVIFHRVVFIFFFRMHKDIACIHFTANVSAEMSVGVLSVLTDMYL